MIWRKPEEAVPLLLARLNKAREWALWGTRTGNNAAADQDLGTKSLLVSKFSDIENELQGMKDSFPRIKHLEKEVMEQFCVLEQELDDDMFKDHEMEEDVSEKLDLIKEDLVKLKGLISTVDNGVSDKLRAMSFKPKYQHAEDNDDDDQVVSEEWEKLGVENKFFESKATSSLLRSFECLESSQLKMCTMCLTIFPENSIIRKKTLIYWWIGEGLVTKINSETAEEVGEQVFQQLLIEGFIKPSQDNYTSVNSFIVHPWIRRMLILAAQKNNFLTFYSPRKPCNSSRRAFLWGGNDHDSYRMSNGEREEDLLTVFNLKEQYLGAKSEWLAKLKRLEVLQLGSWTSSTTHHIEVENQELLNGLGSQKRLKYLSLRGISRIETLPPSIVKLIRLEILDLRACHNLEKLPPGISALMNLTHLDVSECYLLESMPKGIEHLLALQVLKGFVIDKYFKRKSCTIRDLRKLEKLRKLSIRVPTNNGDIQPYEIDIPGLQILTISWGVTSPRPAHLKLPTSLKKLDLRCANFNQTPSFDWLFQPNLEKLYISGGNLNSLEALAGFTGKFLRFKYLNDLEIGDNNLGSLFPEYLRLEITNCKKVAPDVIMDRRNDHRASDQIPHSSSILQLCSI